MADIDGDTNESSEDELLGSIEWATSKDYRIEPKDDAFKKTFEAESFPSAPESFSKILANRGGTVKSAQKTDDPVTLYSALDVVEPVYSLDNLAKLYDADPFHASAVDALVDNIVSLGYYFDYSRKADKLRAKKAREGQDAKEKADDKFEDEKDKLEDRIATFNQIDLFQEVLYKVAKDRFTTGNGYMEIGRTVDGRIGYIGHVPASTIRIRRLRDGFVQYVGSKPVFFKNYGDTSARNPYGGARANELIHYKKYSPIDEYYGVPEVVSAIDAIASNRFATQYNIEYFENKAVPRYMIKVRGVKLSLTQKRDLIKLFDAETKGRSHRTILVPLPGNDKAEIEFVPVENGKQEASFMESINSNIKTILARHRVPMNRLGITEGSSLAGSRDADKIFKESVCRPEQRVFEMLVGRVFKELTQAFVFKLNEYTLTDEDQQSIIDDRDIKNGSMIPDERRVKLGLPPRPDGNGDEAIDLRSLAQLEIDAAKEAQQVTIKSTEKLAAQSNKASVEAAKNAPPPVAGAVPAKAAGAKAPAKKAAPGAAQAKADQKGAGNRTRDSQRSATRSNAAQAPATRNPKGEGRQSK